jgi:hypothetical protein
VSAGAGGAGGAITIGPSDDPTPALDAIKSKRKDAFVALTADWCGNCTNLKRHAAAPLAPLRAWTGPKYFMDEAHSDRFLAAAGIKGPHPGYPLVFASGKVVPGHDGGDSEFGRFK